MLLGAAALLLAGCDGGSATPARDHADAGAPAGMAEGAGAASGGERADASGAAADQVDHRHDPVTVVDGAPMWANSKKYGAEESAEYHFKRDGADFGAASVADYVAKAHAFVSKPPKDVLTLTRDNGDRLLYDPKRNIFAVVTKDGAPRTMFKPDQGQAYWDQQQQREADRAKGDDGEKRYTRRSNHRNEDDGEG
jgi:pyocin large subunit-like protein